MMIFSLVAMIGLEKCCITSAGLQWLCHSGERTVARGPLVFLISARTPILWVPIRPRRGASNDTTKVSLKIKKNINVFWLKKKKNNKKKKKKLYVEFCFGCHFKIVYFSTKRIPLD